MSPVALLQSVPHTSTYTAHAPVPAPPCQPHRRKEKKPPPPSPCLRGMLQVLAEALGWMAETVAAFGLATMNVKTIIDWMKADLGSASAPGERGAAMGKRVCVWVQW